MASRLTGLRRTLRWSDFGTRRAGPDPAPGVVATGAQLRATYRYTHVYAEHVPGTRPLQFRLKDDVAVRIVLKSRECFVNAWVFRRPTTFQSTLLHHEQGHYDLVALFCRDMFITLMALKTQTFPTAQGVIHEVRQILSRYDSLIAAVHAPYDRATQHGRNPPQQRRWDGFIQSAFTRPRNSGMRAPDGALYKVPLATVLRSARVSI